MSVFDDADGTLSRVTSIPTMLNPSYVNFDMEKHFFFSVMQDASRRGFVRSYRVEPQGFEPVCDADTGGDGPCYVAVSPSNRYVAACNFPSGSFKSGRWTARTAFARRPSSWGQRAQAAPRAVRTRTARSGRPGRGRFIRLDWAARVVPLSGQPRGCAESDRPSRPPAAARGI